MSDLSQKAILKHVFKSPLLRNILFIYLAIAILLPVYGVMFELPSFKKMVGKEAITDSRRITAHLAEMIFPGSNQLAGEVLSDEAILEIEKLFGTFEFEQINLFSKSGKIIYSTNPASIGKINRKKYFQNIVAKGNIYYKVLSKGAKSAQGRVVKTDVVETYVPLMHDGAFQGAFEIYYNITNKIKMFQRLLRHFASMIANDGWISQKPCR